MSLPEPLTPPDCDLRDFPRMMIDITRIFSSGFNTAASRNPIAWMIGHKLWYRSWHQVPAGSLPDDDEELCHLAELGFDLKTFKKARAVAMRGWVKCADGRIYHPTVCEIALESWIEKLMQRLSSGAGNAKRWGAAFDPSAIEADIENAVGKLQHLAPNSKAIPKARRRQSQRDAIGNANGIPPGQKGDPTGTPKSSHRESRTPGKSSQGTGTGTGTGNLIEDDERAGAPARDPFPADLISLTAEICRLAGIRHVDPGHVIAHNAMVKGWIDDGLDPDATIGPAIQETLANTTERIGSLKFFDHSVRQFQARREARAHGYRDHSNDQEPANPMVRAIGSRRARRAAEGGDIEPLRLPAGDR
jgi:hypothetical protein